MTTLHRAPQEESLLLGLELVASPWLIHYEHPLGYIAVSHLFPDIRRYCCDNCGAHHWGRYFAPSGWYDVGYDYDYEYKHPDDTPYLCANGHVKQLGCDRECWECRWDGARS